MAEKKIKICDRCGKEIKHGIFPYTFNSVFKTVMFGFGDYDYSREFVELCKECTKAFERFLKGGDG